jgi:hypothetical protein
MKALLLLVLVIAPVQLQALSCMPWTLEHSYAAAADSDEDYVIAQGTLNFPKRKLPKVDWNRQQDTPPITEIRGRIEGKALSRNGFTVPFDTDLIITVRCTGPWCPSVTPGKEHLVFLKKSGSRYALDFGPCSSMGWIEPTGQMLKRVEACLAGADCTPKTR